MSSDSGVVLSNLRLGSHVSYAIVHKFDDDLGIEMVRGELPFWLVSDEFLANISDSPDRFSILNEIHFEKISTHSPTNGTSLFICLNPDMLDSYILAIGYFKEENKYGLN